MTYKLVITGDMNDGDLVTKITDIDIADISLIVSIIEAIEATEGYNYPTGDADGCRNDKQSAYDLYKNYPYLDFFDSFVPYGECGIHTIESISLLTVTEETKLL